MKIRILSVSLAGSDNFT